MQLAVEAIQTVVARAAELRTVVAGEHDQGVFAQAELFHAFEQAPDVTIQTADHGVEYFDGFAQVVAVAEYGQVFFGCLQRCVWRVVSEMQVEWVFWAALDKVDRFVGPEVGEIAAIGALHAVAGFEPPVVVVVHAATKTDGFVEAALFRFVAGIKCTEVPLAD